jgi:hypothetical protein
MDPKREAELAGAFPSMIGAGKSSTGPVGCCPKLDESVDESIEAEASGRSTDPASGFARPAGNPEGLLPAHAASVIAIASEPPRPIRT